MSSVQKKVENIYAAKAESLKEILNEILKMLKYLKDIRSLTVFTINHIVEINSIETYPAYLKVHLH